MISSAAFPKVAFSKPPMRGLVRAAKDSVPSPIKYAKGIMAIAESTNIHSDPQLRYLAAIANGNASNKMDNGLRIIDDRMVFTAMSPL